MADNDQESYGEAVPEILGGNTLFLLSWVSRGADRRFHRALERHDLTPHQLGVLSILRGGPLVQARISERLDVFKPAMVALVSQLEEKGLVERRPHPSDRRAIEVHLLPAAAERLRAVDADLGGLADDVLRPLDADDRAHLHELLTRLAARRGANGTQPSETAPTSPENP